MKDIFYFFNYIEWITIIFILSIFKYSLINVNDSADLFMHTIFCVAFIIMILAIRGGRGLYTWNAYKYKCVYKTKQIIIDEKIYYVPIVEIYTYIGSRYIKLIDNSNTDHLSDISFFQFTSNIENNGFEIPSYYKKFCYNTEEKAYYEIINCKKYIDEKKKKYSRKIISNEIIINFKK